MRVTVIDNVLWCLTPIFMSVTAVFLCRRHLQKQFPYFFNYVIFQILAFLVEFPLRNWTNYFYVYWTVQALSLVVSFAVLLEIFRDAFRPYEALRDLSIILFRWCALVVLLLGGMWAITSWRENQIDNITNAIYLIDRSVRLMQCGLVLFMLLFSEYLGIRRRNLLFGIAVGFGFFAAVNMLVMTALSHHSYFSKSTLSRINGIAYVISTLIWLAYAALPSTVRSGAKQVAEATQKWDQALDDARNAAPVTSLLDSMDQTVERLLYHRESEAGVTVATRR